MPAPYEEFNPDVDKHRELADAIVDVLQETDKEYLPTGAVQDKLIERGWASESNKDGTWSPGWLRILITYARPYLIDQERVETTEKQRQGLPTHYWKAVE